MNQERLMNQEIDNDEITIDLTELFMALWSRLHIILMAGVLGALIAFVGTNLLVTPMYTSETKVYVLTRSDSTAGITYNDLQMGTQLTQDYMQLVTSRPVLEQVIAVLNLDMEPESVKRHDLGGDAGGDPYLKYPRPERRSQAGQRNRRCGKRLCQHPDHGDHGRRCGQHGGGGEPSYQPLIAQHPQEYCHWRPFGLILAMGVITLIFILDDTIKTPDDVEHYLGLNTLTSIPISEGMKKGKKVKKLPEKQMMRNMKR